MEGNSRVSKVNVILAGIAIVSLIITVAIMNLPKLRAQIEKTLKNSETIENSYAEETINQADISKNGDGSVIATLASDGTLTISGSGEMRDFASSESLIALFESEEITKVIIKKGVTNIGNYAFEGSSKLTSIIIPEGVIKIGCNVLKGCTSLTSINIPNSVSDIGYEAFSECNSLISINIPNSVISIGHSAFYKCANLVEINIPEGITSIENDMFFGCSKLTSINMPESLISIKNRAFQGCSNLASIDIPQNVTSIGKTAFSGCSGLRSINIPEGVTSIEDEVFRGCNNLESISIPEEITSIGRFAFYFCNSLTNINIPKKVTSIGEYAFYGCRTLASINIPSSVVNIGQYAVSSCYKLKEIKVDDNNEKYMDDNGVLYTKDKIKIIKYPEGKEGSIYTILDGVTKIESEAFYKCIDLTNIEIPNSVTSIGSSAFRECGSLTSIEIPSNVKIIEERLFLWCSSLTNINIPEGVTSIKNSAFKGCASLESINIPNSVANIGEEAFSGCKITKTIYKGEEINLPDIIQRTLAEDDILYTSQELLLTNCTIEENKIVIDDNKTFAEIEVQDGTLKGLKYLIVYLEWDISANGDGSVIAALTEEGLLTISGTGSMKNWSQSNKPDWEDVIVNKDIKNVSIMEGVTNIGEYAFYECSSLVSINIPEGLTNIEKSAFSGCSSLTSMEIPSSVTSIGEYVFSSCDNLKEIKVNDNNENYMDDNGVLYTKDKTEIIKYPEAREDSEYTVLEGVTNISNVFMNCSNLVSIVIPEGVTSFGLSPFIGCSSLKEIKVDDNNEKYMDADGVLYRKDTMAIIKYPQAREDNKYRIIEGTIGISSDAFRDCSNLAIIEIPNSVSSIGQHTFSRCSNLTSINIPEGVTSIPNGAFYECSSLTNINIPKGVTTIESNTFEGCSSLTEIEIPNCVISIGNRAFAGCTNLMLICGIDSTAHNYAKENTINYLATRSNIVNNYIKGIQPETTYENLANHIDTNMEYKIIENSEEITGEALIKTGQKLTVNNKTYTLVVTGDVNGDGKTNIVDLSRLKLAIVGTLNLEGEYKEATDVNSNGQTLQLTDLSKIKLYIVGKSNI